MAARKKSETDILEMLRANGAWAYKIADAAKCPRCSTVVHGARRPADVFFSYQGMAGLVEVKSSPTYSFQYVTCKDHEPMSMRDFLMGKERWPDHLMEARVGLVSHQRRALTVFDAMGGAAWLALQLGSGRVNSQEKPRRMFFVPWRVWIKYELLLYGHGTLSASLAPHQISLREFSMEVFMTPYELTWRKGSQWIIPNSHILRTTYKIPG